MAFAIKLLSRATLPLNKDGRFRLRDPCDQGQNLLHLVAPGNDIGKIIPFVEKNVKRLISEVSRVFSRPRSIWRRRSRWSIGFVR